MYNIWDSPKKSAYPKFWHKKNWHELLDLGIPYLQTNIYSENHAGQNDATFVVYLTLRKDSGNLDIYVSTLKNNLMINSHVSHFSTLKETGQLTVYYESKNCPTPKICGFPITKWLSSRWSTSASCEKYLRGGILGTCTIIIQRIGKKICRKTMGFCSSLFEVFLQIFVDIPLKQFLES